MKLTLTFSFLFIIISSLQSQVTEKHLVLGSATDIVETADHNFIMTLNENPNPNPNSINVMKIDSAGNKMWLKHYGMFNAQDHNAADILRIADTLYLITGEENPGISPPMQLYCLLIDSMGNIVWEKLFGPAYSNGLTAAFDSVSNVIYLCGTAPDSTARVYLAKINLSGDLLWEKLINLNGDGETGNKIIIRSPTELFIAGDKHNPSSPSDIDGFLMKLDSSGNNVWAKYYGGSDVDEILDFHSCPDNGFLILAHSNSTVSGGAPWLVRVNENGDTLWTKTIELPSPAIAYSFAYSDSNSIWLCGWGPYSSPPTNHALILKTDSAGNVLYSNYLGGNQSETLSSIIISDNRSVFAVGESNPSTVQVYMVRIDSIDAVNGIPIYTSGTYEAYPNPSSDYIQVKLPLEKDMNKIDVSVFDATSRQISTTVDTEIDRLRITFKGNPGLYFINITSPDHRYTIRAMKY